jgi:hypothetical protein
MGGGDGMDLDVQNAQRVLTALMNAEQLLADGHLAAALTGFTAARELWRQLCPATFGAHAAAYLNLCTGAVCESMRNPLAAVAHYVAAHDGLHVRPASAGAGLQRPGSAPPASGTGAAPNANKLLLALVTSCMAGPAFAAGDYTGAGRACASALQSYQQLYREIAATAESAALAAGSEEEELAWLRLEDLPRRLIACENNLAAAMALGGALADAATAVRRAAAVAARAFELGDPLRATVESNTELMCKLPGAFAANLTRRPALLAQRRDAKWLATDAVSIVAPLAGRLAPQGKAGSGVRPRK